MAGTGFVFYGPALLPRGTLDPGLPQHSPALPSTGVSPGKPVLQPLLWSYP